MPQNQGGIDNGNVWDRAEILSKGEGWMINLTKIVYNFKKSLK